MSFCDLASLRWDGAPCARLRDGGADLIEKWDEVWLLAVDRDRHVRRRDVETDVEVLVLRRLRDGVAEAASENVDVALVASSHRFRPATGVRLTNTASLMSAQSFSVAHASTTKGISAANGSAAKLSGPVGDGIGGIGKRIRSHHSEPFRVDRRAFSRATSSSFAAC